MGGGAGCAAGGEAVEAAAGGLRCLGAGAFVASDGGAVARGWGAVSPCNKAPNWENWHPASNNIMAIDHGWARKRERQAKEAVIGGVDFS